MPSLVEALEHKYGNECSTESEGSEEELCVSIFVPRRPPRVLVPSLLVLNDCDITTAGEREALTDKCAAVEELDLAKNKLNKWREIFGILQQMPLLKFVNLSFNQLSEPVHEGLPLKWTNLKNLVLNSTNIDWVSVDKILDHSPVLEELHLSLNDYKDVKLTCARHPDEELMETSDETTNANENCTCPKLTDTKKHQKHLGIKKLHFNGNPVSCWNEISKLGYAFPNLEYLVLADCPIETLHRPMDQQEDNHNDDKTDESHDGFVTLKFLNLNGTQLSTWDEIERLSKFPNLHCLRMQGCPLWESSEYTEHERRQLMIARLPNVAMLNGGGTIGSDEREDAERAFIRYYMDKPESDRPERYFELLKIHGKLDPLVNVDLRPEKRVKVTFTCGSNSEVRSVDVYRTVMDLKSKLEQFAGFSAGRMRLFYVDQYSQSPEEMKYPNKQLYSYNISSGDEIIIDSKKKLSESKI